MKVSISLLGILLLTTCFCQKNSLKIARLQYGGSGDWYANETSLPNLIRYTNQYLKTSIAPKEDYVKPISRQISGYPLVHMTGHGNVTFTEEEASNLRNYLISGGFLHIDDNYGMDVFVRLEMKKVFPELEFINVPFDHEIYHHPFKFKEGLPKIHEHDNRPPQGLALLWEGKIVCFYTYETDLGDGWEDANIHNDPQQIREKALKMGANIIFYALNGE